MEPPVTTVNNHKFTESFKNKDKTRYYRVLSLFLKLSAHDNLLILWLNDSYNGLITTRRSIPSPLLSVLISGYSISAVCIILRSKADIGFISTSFLK